MKILLIEDNIRLGETISLILKKENYIVDWFTSGIDGEDNALTNIYDVLIIDWMLPEKNGLSIIRTLRQNTLSTPILMLTAKGEIDDKILALDGGADDYLTKPFDYKELLARIRALLRRRATYENDLLIFYDLKLSSNELILYHGERSISLSLKEVHLLEMLMLAKGNPVLKERIIEKVWGYDGSADNNHVEVYISFLRRKLKTLHSNVIITTLRGVGYALKENL